MRQAGSVKDLLALAWRVLQHSAHGIYLAGCDPFYCELQDGEVWDGANWTLRREPAPEVVLARKALAPYLFPQTAAEIALAALARFTL